MKLAFITATPQNSELGSGTFVGNDRLIRALRERGHDVDVVAPAHGQGRLGYTVHRFAWNARLRPRDFDAYDAVIGLDMDGVRVAGRTRPPFVAYIHGIIADEATFERGAVRLSLQLQALAERASVQRADAVVTTSRYSAARLATLYQLPAARIKIVPPPIDVAGWDAACARLAVSEAPRPTILCVGVQYPRKSVDTLIRAVALLRVDVPDVCLRIASKGPEWENLRALTAQLGLGDVVTFLGHVPFDALVAEYQACTLFCLPSLQEGWGLVFAEAMASRKTVVACRSSSTPEVIEDGVSGLLCHPRDPVDLARQLARALKDPALRQSLGEAGRATALAYDATLMAGRLLDVLSA